MYLFRKGKREKQEELVFYAIGSDAGRRNESERNSILRKELPRQLKTQA